MYLSETIMQLAASLVSLILAVNPLSGLPYVLAAPTSRADPHHKTALRRIALTVGIGTFLAALTGYRILSIFGISQHAFQIGAGLLLIVTGAQKFIHVRTAMSGPQQPVFRAHKRLRKTRHVITNKAVSLANSAVSPVGIPILVGPAAIAVCVLNGSQYAGIGGIAINACLSIVVGIVVYICYLGASKIRTWLDKWNHALMCVIGLILLCRGIDVVTHALGAVAK